MSKEQICKNCRFWKPEDRGLSVFGWCTKLDEYIVCDNGTIIPSFEPRKDFGCNLFKPLEDEV